MKLHRALIFACGTAVVLPACAANSTSGDSDRGARSSAVAQVPDSTRLMRTISVLAHDSMEGRAVGTPGGAKARAFLVNELRARGVQPLGSQDYLQHFKIAAGRGAAAADSIPGANILGVIRGTERPNSYIVVSAHYDHVGMRDGEVFNGADDNASGTAAILEVASWFVANRPKQSIVIALFDAEERGLQGATRFVASNMIPRDSMILNVNLDMVGRNDRNELYAAGTARYPSLKRYVETAASRSGVKLLMGHDVQGSGRDDWTSQSDQGAFHRVGVPFLYFGVEDHPDYHKATDEMRGIMPGFYVNAVRAVLDVVKLIDADPPRR